jgi:hypothetical protein
MLHVRNHYDEKERAMQVIFITIIPADAVKDRWTGPEVNLSDAPGIQAPPDLFAIKLELA